MKTYDEIEAEAAISSALIDEVIAFLCEKQIDYAEAEFVLAFALDRIKRASRRELARLPLQKDTIARRK